MPLEPATNAIVIEALKTLQAKDENDRTEFERHIFARMVELKDLVERGNRSVDQYAAQLEQAREQTLKACGAYENTADMLATYYVQRRQEETAKEKHASLLEVEKVVRESDAKKIKPVKPVEIQLEIKNNQP